MIYLIRHGKTKGNEEHRYVGKTDEDLLPEEGKRLRDMTRPKAERIFTSPMKRCIQTAQTLYPNGKIQVVKEFTECDFGEFEYKNYEELNGDPRYQKFIDSEGRTGFPGGETRETYTKRIVEAFAQWAKKECTDKKEFDEKREDIAIITHGGMIMAVLETFGVPKKDYYDWQVKNGEGYACEYAWKDDKPCLCVRYGWRM